MEPLSITTRSGLTVFTPCARQHLGTEKPESLGIGLKDNKQILKVWWEKSFRETKQGEPVASSTGPLCCLEIRAGPCLEGLMGWGESAEGEAFTEQARGSQFESQELIQSQARWCTPVIPTTPPEKWETETGEPPPETLWPVNLKNNKRPRLK